MQSLKLRTIEGFVMKHRSFFQIALAAIPFAVAAGQIPPVPPVPPVRPVPVEPPVPRAVGVSGGMRCGEQGPLIPLRNEQPVHQRLSDVSDHATSLRWAVAGEWVRAFVLRLGEGQ